MRAVLSFPSSLYHIVTTHIVVYRGCKMYFIASGGVTHWALAPDEDGSVMTIAWGQNASNGQSTVLLAYA